MAIEFDVVEMSAAAPAAVARVTLLLGVRQRFLPRTLVLLKRLHGRGPADQAGPRLQLYERKRCIMDLKCCYKENHVSNTYLHC